MFTYEVNLLCDCRCHTCGAGRRAMLVSEPMTTALQGQKNVEKRARDRQWKRRGAKWYCPFCTSGKTIPNSNREHPAAASGPDSASSSA